MGMWANYAPAPLFTGLDAVFGHNPKYIGPLATHFINYHFLSI